MKNIDSRLLIGGVIVLIVVLLVGSKIIGGDGSGLPGGVSSYAGSAGSTVENGLAPDFSLSQIGGGTISLSDFRGEKPVVLDFFATWCPNCRRDMPKLSRMYDKYKDQVEVIGINLQENESVVQKFVSSANISFPIVMDPFSQVSRAYGVRYTNYHVLINKEGQIAGIVPGDINESQLKSLIDES